MAYLPLLFLFLMWKQLASWFLPKKSNHKATYYDTLASSLTVPPLIRIV